MTTRLGVTKALDFLAADAEEYVRGDLAHQMAGMLLQHVQVERDEAHRRYVFRLEVDVWPGRPAPTKVAPASEAKLAEIVATLREARRFVIGDDLRRRIDEAVALLSAPPPAAPAAPPAAAPAAAPAEGGDSVFTLGDIRAAVVAHKKVRLRDGDVVTLSGHIAVKDGGRFASATIVEERPGRRAALVNLVPGVASNGSDVVEILPAAAPAASAPAPHVFPDGVIEAAIAAKARVRLRAGGTATISGVFTRTGRLVIVTVENQVDTDVGTASFDRVPGITPGPSDVVEILTA